MSISRMVLALLASTAAAVLALPVLALGLPFWITTVVVRALARRIEPRTASWSDITVFDAELGWRTRPHLDVYCVEERDDVFRVRTGADGWHGRGSIEDSEVVVVGDSHAFGYGIDADACFASVISRPRIKAIGAPGYNMVQELLLMRQVAPQLRGKGVVWFVYPGNDFYDNMAPSTHGYRMPFVREGRSDWEIVTRHLSQARWTASAGRAGEHHFPTLAALYAQTHLADRAYRACEFLIREGSDLCRGVGARLVVMLIPCPVALDAPGLALLRAKAHDPAGVDPDLPGRRIREICSATGVPFVDLGDFIDRSHFKPHDDHLTEAGHRILAGVIASTFFEATRAHSPACEETTPADGTRSS